MFYSKTNEWVRINSIHFTILFLHVSLYRQVYIDPLYIVDENGLGLEAASGLAIDNHDRIFISDTGHHRIVICTPEGSYITSFGTQGDGLGQLKRPCGLDMTSDEILVVTDPGNKRLQLFGLIQEQTVVENNPPPATFSQEEEDPFVNL
jgi:sugar lactone lactonase YvrE